MKTNLSPDRKVQVASQRATVYPLIDKISAASSLGAHDFSSDPDAIDVHSAAGGFSALVQVAASECLRVFDLDLKLGTADQHISARDLLTFVKSQPQPLASAFLNTLTEAAPPFSFYTLSVSYAPRALTFEDPHNVKIIYDVTLAISGPSSIAAELATSVMPTTQQRPGASIVSTMQQFPGASIIPGTTNRIDISRVAGSLPPRVLGHYTITITGSYEPRKYTNAAQAAMVFDLRQASVHYGFSDGDIKKIYDRFLGGPDAPLPRIFDPALDPYVQLTPLVSLIGPQIYYYIQHNVTDRFDVKVFHVNDLTPTTRRQAAAIGMNIVANMDGDPEVTPHFIGSEAYGVIWDESALSILFKQTWKNWGLSGPFVEEASIRLQIDGVEQEVTLAGTLVLTSLDIISIVADANTRTDYVAIGGTCVITPRGVTLQDGRVLAPPEVDLGPPLDQEWGALTTPDLVPTLVIDPTIRQLQINAQEQTYQFIAKPFGKLPTRDSATPVYVRTEAVSQRPPAKPEACKRMSGSKPHSPSGEHPSTRSVGQF